MLKIATVFSGIGSIEWALKRQDINHEIVFACDNGERYLTESFEDISKQLVGKTAKEVKEYIEKNYKLTVPMESSLGRNCFLCKHFSETPTHGSVILGECLKKENMVWHPADRYNGSCKTYKIVSDDDLCEYFEKNK